MGKNISVQFLKLLIKRILLTLKNIIVTGVFHQSDIMLHPLEDPRPLNDHPNKRK